MTTLADIEEAADALPQEQKEELFLFLATRLRATHGATPAPREFTREQIEQWIEDDETSHQRLLTEQ